MSRIAVPVLPRWLRWAAVLAVAAGVFYLSVVAVPPEEPLVAPPGPPELLPLDKWRHFLAYGALAGSLTYATVDWKWPPARLAVLVVGIAAAYGLGVEGIQATTPDRYFSMGDAYANVLGALLVLPWFAVRSRVPFVRVPESERSSQSEEADDRSAE
jgi:VanZ family protein